MHSGKVLAVLVFLCFPNTAFAQAGDPTATPTTADVQPAVCNPPCRAAYTCVEGKCVSLCNPTCESGAVCSSVGTCVAKPRVPEAALPRRPESQPYQENADPGWARGAGVFGVVNASLIGLTLAVGLSSNDRDTQIALGASIVGYGALTTPIVAIGGGSARSHPNVRGKSGLRIVGWIGYTAFLVDGVVLVAAASSGEDVPEPVAVSAVLLGISVELAFAADAFASANQAERIGTKVTQSHGPQLRPYFGIRPEREGGTSGVVGIRGVLW